MMQHSPKKKKPAYDWRNESLNRKAPEPAPPAKDHSKRGPLSRCEISLAENGFQVECRYQPPKRDGKETKECMPSFDYDSLTTRHVFNTAAETAAFVKEQLS